MDDSFKTYLQDFLKRYYISPKGIDFDSVSDFDSMLKQMAICNIDSSNIQTFLEVIFDLHEKGIYLYKPDYKTCEAYISEKDKWIIDDKKGTFSTENYIERFLLDGESLKAVYKDESIYTMGNPFPLNSSHCKMNRLAKEIAERFYFYPDIIKDEAKRIIYQVMNNLQRDGGIISRLKRDLGLDIKAIDETKYGYQKYKITYFVYEMDNTVIPKLLGKEEFNMLKFLNTLCTESVDNSILEEVHYLDERSYPWETDSSKVTRLIKNTLEKEMELSTLNNIRIAFHKVALEWERLRKYVFDIMEFKAEKWDRIYDIKQFIREMEAVPIDLCENSNQTSPITAIYWKVYQCEFIGELQEYKNMYEMKIDANYNVPPKFVPDMRRLHTEKIPRYNVTDYICGNAGFLVQYVYLEDKLEKKDQEDKQRKIRNSAKQVSNLIDHYFRRRPLFGFENEIAKLFIISCLQTILTDKNNNSFKNTTYGFKDCKPVQDRGALRESKGYTSDIRLMYWERKVGNHLQANLGRYKMVCAFREFLIKSCDIQTKIYSYQSIPEMLRMQQSYYERVVEFFSH